MNKVKIPWQLWVGGIMIAIGLTIAVLGTQSLNNIVMFLGVIIMGPGAYLFYRGWQSRGDMVYGNESKNKSVDGKLAPVPNCVIIRPKRVETEYLEPEYVEDIPINAMIRKCHSNNKKYYLLMEDPGDKESLMDVVLPDDDKSKVYFNPKEFANAATMPSNKKYFEWSATIFQKIAIGLMVLIIVVEIIGLVILGE